MACFLIFSISSTIYFSFWIYYYVIALSPRYCANLIYFSLSRSWIRVKRFKYYFSAILAGFIGLMSYSIFLALTNFLISVFFMLTVPVWLGFIVPVANCCWVADILPDYLLFKRGWGVFLLSSPSLRGANFDDLILLDWFRAVFWDPEPTILIGRGWKSNCWICK